MNRTGNGEIGLRRDPPAEAVVIPAGPRATQLLDRCRAHARSMGIPVDGPAHAFFVPGRIEILGKHTDYAGGRSLLCATDRGMVVFAVPRGDRGVGVTDAATGERVELALDPALPPGLGWHRYPTAVTRRIARNFPGELRGAELVVASDLPRAAGMSSSSALVIAVFLALSSVNRLPQRQEYRTAIRMREDLAGFLAAVESGADFGALPGDEGVGTRGGSQDHTAILCAAPGRLVRYGFAPTRFEAAMDLPAGHSLMIAVSGVVAEKTGAAMHRYNQAAARMREAVAIWRRETGRSDQTLGEALADGVDAQDRIRAAIRRAAALEGRADTLLARIDQFIEETTLIVPGATDALASGDLEAFGRWVDRSQHLAETALGNQVPETVALARSARELGAVAASAFGAGFGGSVWALVAEGDLAGFPDRWRDDYLDRFPHRASGAAFFATAPGPPAAPLHL